MMNTDGGNQCILGGIDHCFDHNLSCFSEQNQL